MGWCHFDGTGACFWVRIFIRNNGDATANEWQDAMLADKVLVALIIGVHRDASITQHGFGPGCGDGDVRAIFAFNRISEMPEMAVGFCRQHLKV